MTDIAGLLDQLAREEGVNSTNVGGVRIYRASQPSARVPLCYNQGLIFVGQGKKRLFYGGEVYDYDPNNHLVIAMPIPAECETFLKRDEPLLSLMIDLDLQVVSSIIDELEYDMAPVATEGRPKPKGLHVSPNTEVIRDIIFRLLQALQSPIDSKLLGKQIIRELFFRVLQGENRENLMALTTKNTDLARVNKALHLIHTEFNTPINVNNLANMVNMSMSSFHRIFKEVTATSPIQYVKRVRLTKARGLLLDEGLRVNEVATAVGYESSAQFSREFKRFFGLSPIECR